MLEQSSGRHWEDFTSADHDDELALGEWRHQRHHREIERFCEGFYGMIGDDPHAQSM